MKTNRRQLTVFLLVTVSLLLFHSGVLAAPGEEAKSSDRCAVCGMFVAKYPNWLVQISHADGKVQWFDGAKDMLAYYFDPGRFGSHSVDLIEEIWVKDYYSMGWTDGRQAYYVTGSGVHGPMGHEFVPFSSREAAENFLKDHHGDKVWSFIEITAEKVESLRAGQKMKMKGAHEGGEHRNDGRHGRSHGDR
jgi:copper chaperone NosL